MLEFRLLFQKAFADKVVRVPCTSPPVASNLRQRLYRYRDKIRQDISDEFNILVDHLHFEIGVRELVITYNNPNEKLLEVLDERRQDTGNEVNASALWCEAKDARILELLFAGDSVVAHGRVEEFREDWGE